MSASPEALGVGRMTRPSSQKIHSELLNQISQMSMQS
jgi:hypothetical protein